MPVDGDNAPFPAIYETDDGAAANSGISQTRPRYPDRSTREY